MDLARALGIPRFQGIRSKEPEYMWPLLQEFLITRMYLDALANTRSTVLLTSHLVSTCLCFYLVRLYVAAMLLPSTAYPKGPCAVLYRLWPKGSAYVVTLRLCMYYMNLNPLGHLVAVADAVDDVHPASPNIYYAALVSIVFVYKVMQDFYHQQYDPVTCSPSRVSPRELV